MESHQPTFGNPNQSSSLKSKRKRPAFPPLEPKYYDLDPSLARTIKPNITLSYISKAKKFLGSDVEVIMANPEMSIVDHCSGGANSFDVCVHMGSVKCGLRFPLHPFISNFFNSHEIIPAQLAPNGYKFLVVFLNVCEECNVPPSLSLFHYLFNVEPATATENKGFVTISSRRGYKFVTDLPGNHMGWKKKFIKVRLPPSQISFNNVWATRVMCFPHPKETPELMSQVEKIARVSRYCKDYATEEKVKILYGLNAAPELPHAHVEEPLIPMHQACKKIKVEAVEESAGWEKGEKIKALERELFIAKQSGADEFKKSKEFEKAALEYIHKNLEAFLGWELCDEGRRKAFFKIMDDNPAWIQKKIQNQNQNQKEKDGSSYYRCKRSMQISMYENIMLEFDAINATKTTRL